MKNLKTILILLLSTGFVFSQNYTDEKDNNPTQQELLYLNNGQTNYNSSVTANTVFVKQEGDNNEVTTTLKSSDSEVGIVQIGDGNEVDLTVTALQIRAQVQQLGDNNIFVDYSNDPLGNYNAQINQTGNNQSIFVNGSTSLSKKIQVNLTGNDKTIFINNFN